MNNSKNNYLSTGGKHDNGDIDNGDIWGVELGNGDDCDSFHLRCVRVHLRRSSWLRFCEDHVAGTHDHNRQGGNNYQLDRKQKFLFKFLSQGERHTHWDRENIADNLKGAFSFCSLLF